MINDNKFICPDCKSINTFYCVDSMWEYFSVGGGDWGMNVVCWKCGGSFIKFRYYNSLVPIPKPSKK